MSDQSKQLTEMVLKELEKAGINAKKVGRNDITSAIVGNRLKKLHINLRESYRFSVH